MHGVKDARQAEIHTAEPLVHEPSAAEVELAIDKLKSHCKFQDRHEKKAVPPRNTGVGNGPQHPKPLDNVDN